MVCIYYQDRQPTSNWRKGICWTPHSATQLLRWWCLGLLGSYWYRPQPSKVLTWTSRCLCYKKVYRLRLNWRSLVWDRNVYNLRTMLDTRHFCWPTSLHNIVFIAVDASLLMIRLIQRNMFNTEWHIWSEYSWAFALWYEGKWKPSNSSPSVLLTRLHSMRLILSTCFVQVMAWLNPRHTLEGESTLTLFFIIFICTNCSHTHPRNW